MAAQSDGTDAAAPVALALGVDSLTTEADSLAAGAGTSRTAPRRSAVGVVIGIPQILGVTWETELWSPLRFQANAGTIIALTSVNARFLITPAAWSVQPYAFAGGGTFFALAIEDFDTFEPYSWFGYGLRLRIHRVLVYGEMSFLGGDPEVEGPGVGGGVLFRY